MKRRVWFSVCIVAILAACSATEQVIPVGSDWTKIPQVTAEEKQSAYADGRLDKNDPTYWVGEHPVEEWKAAPLRSDSGKTHGYKQGFTAFEIMVVEQNMHLADLATGKYPSQYAFPILEGVRKGLISRAKCKYAHVRFSDHRWIPPGMYPVRDFKDDHRGNVEVAVVRHEGGWYAESLLPLYDGVTVLALHNDPFLLATDRNPQVSWEVFHGGDPLPLQFLPAGNNSTRITSAPWNQARGRENEILEGVQEGALLVIGIVKPGVCS
jgi:hypothetical protein